MIYKDFGENNGFRIAFSDPSRRKDIVANNYEFERFSVMLPILFLGFPPITSATIDLNHMLNICDKFGMIINHYMKKSTNSQMRSYFLFTYDSVKTAIRAKQELCRRKDLLGEKRVEITLLLDEESILQGRDFSYTEKHFLNDQGSERGKRGPFRNFQPPSHNFHESNYQHQHPSQRQHSGGYPPSQGLPYHQPPYYEQPARYPPSQGYYYPPEMQPPKQP